MIMFDYTSHREMKVNSMEELDSLADRLLKNPTFFDVILERDSKIPMDRYRYITKGELNMRPVMVQGQ